MTILANTKSFLAEFENGVLTITLDDPPANTYSYEMMQELDAAILAAAELATTGQALRGGSELIQIRQRER